jgi:hypothetical protein
MPTAVEQFKETLRKLCTELENMSIENEVCSDLIINVGIVSLDELKRAVNRALADPEKRKEARKQFAEMWVALDQFGTAAFYEELLRDLPPSGKPS